MSATNYKVKEGEENLFHVMFTRIVKVGKRTRDDNFMQTFTPREWYAMTKGKGNAPATFDMGMGGITQFDEVKVIHDPTKQTVKEAEKPKQGRPPKKD